MDKKNLMIGVDLNRNGTQICYYEKTTGDAVSVPVKVGSSQVAFPTVLCKVGETGEWYYGLEAKYFAEQKKGILIDRIVEFCSEGTTLSVGEEEYTGDQLLTIFLRKALTLAGITDPAAQIAGIMITVPDLSRFFVKAIRRAYENLGIPRSRGYLQDYRESFFVHTLCQKQDLWTRKTGMFYFQNGNVSFSYMELRFRTKPVTCYIHEGKSTKIWGSSEQKDEQLLAFTGEVLEGEIYSSIFLVGEEFNVSWAKETVKTLCKGGRKVFSGENLFAKGACLSVREKIEEKTLKGYLYVGSNLIRNNIGMEMIMQGVPTYYPLISAGVNWYEAEKSCEIILDQTEELIFLVSPIGTRRRSRYAMKLPGLPKRPNRTTRLLLHLEYESAGKCYIDVEDLGFGDMFPSSGKKWHEIMEDQG